MSSLIKDEFVPHVANEGRLGTPVLPWGEIHAARLLVNGAEVDPTKVLGRYLGQWPRGEAISGARGVYLAEEDGETRVFCSSCLDPAKWAHGFVIEAGAAGSDVSVWGSAVIAGLSGIAPDEIYVLGPNGELTQSLHAQAVTRQIMGTGLTSTSISASVHIPEILTS